MDIFDVNADLFLEPQALAPLLSLSSHDDNDPRPIFDIPVDAEHQPTSSSHFWCIIA
ncbi:hypothetical protein OH77DRAFT_1430385 [Trametes cingulata]|nr:hypothetical protein OH77DRAFT_1430385 [Trametes cingulata]